MADRSVSACLPVRYGRRLCYVVRTWPWDELSLVFNHDFEQKITCLLTPLRSFQCGIAYREIRREQEEKTVWLEGRIFTISYQVIFFIVRTYMNTLIEIKQKKGKYIQINSQDKQSSSLFF